VCTDVLCEVRLVLKKSFALFAALFLLLREQGLLFPGGISFTLSPAGSTRPWGVVPLPPGGVSCTGAWLAEDLSVALEAGA
jgi:hypothetical protein